jgi:peptidoglycan hydrolase-like protein with peptidoglycan-binding domain
MLPRRVTLQLLSFLVLAGGVVANIFFLQTSKTVAPASDDAAWNMAAIEPAEVGDTGSIDRSGAASAAVKAVKASPVASAVRAAQSMSAKDVTRAVQRELQIRGYETGSRDGVVGVMTRGAILAFEYDHGMPLTARPTQELLKAIILGEDGRGAGKRLKETAEAQEVIRSVQRSLAKLGYKSAGTDGRLGAETMRAIRVFEGDQALPETGRISGPLIARLARLSGDGRVASAP